ncbi:hypothetical protein BH11CYA1_BH11CYA1_48220 [soil metagenome]
MSRRNSMIAITTLTLLLSTTCATEAGAKSKSKSPAVNVGDQVTITRSDTTIPLPATIIAISKNKYTVRMLPSFRFKGNEEFEITARQIKLVFPSQEATAKAAEQLKKNDREQAGLVSTKKATLLSASATAGNKARSLSGLYTRFGQTFEGKKMVCKEEQFYFYPDGRVYRAIPAEGPAHLDWAKAINDTPNLCGKYGIIGDTIVFQWNSSEPTVTWKLKRRGNNLEMNGLIADKAPEFPANAKLDGIWARQEIIVTQGKPSTSAVTFIFSTDGTVSLTQKDKSLVMKKLTGKYQLSGNDLELNFNSDNNAGRNSSSTIYPQHLDSRSLKAPDRLSINGKLFEKMQ